jgi:DNA-directed RNA polymerase specialized sigma24 family protein
MTRSRGRRAEVEVAVSSTESLRALVERVKENDLAAFEEIYRDTRPEIARALFHLVGRRDDFEVIVGEAYRELLAALPRHEAGDPVRPLVARICARVASRHLHLWRRRPEAEPACDDGGAHLLHRALEQMRPARRLVFVFHEVLGLPEAEIGRAVGISLRKVLALLRKARLELTEAMRGPVPEEAP